MIKGSTDKIQHTTSSFKITVKQNHVHMHKKSNLISVSEVPMIYQIINLFFILILGAVLIVNVLVFQDGFQNT